jgi:hypothetical protein
MSISDIAQVQRRNHYLTILLQELPIKLGKTPQHSRAIKGYLIVRLDGDGNRCCDMAGRKSSSMPSLNDLLAPASLPNTSTVPISVTTTTTINPNPTTNPTPDPNAIYNVNIVNVPRVDLDPNPNISTYAGSYAGRSGNSLSAIYSVSGAEELSSTTACEWMPKTTI